MAARRRDRGQTVRRRLGSASVAVLVGVLLAACSTDAVPTGGLQGSAAVSSPGGTTAAPQTPATGARPRVLIDTDMAPDDIVAIASLLRDPSVEVVGITVAGTGEAHCPGGMFVARSLITMLREAPLPVGCGYASPLADAEPFPAEWRQGADAGSGLKLARPAFVPDERSAQQMILDLATPRVDRSRLQILTLGPLTNLAAAVELDPTLPDRVRVTSMLGAVGVPGNTGPSEAGSAAATAEWNAHADPTAVKRVLDAGFDLTLVPLDATNSVPLTPDLVRSLEADHAAAPADVVFELWTRNPFITAGGFYLWDPLAAVALRDPHILTTRPARLRVVEGDGADGGRLIEDPAGAAVTIATAADRAAFESRLLAALRLGGPRETPFSPTVTVHATAGNGTCQATLDPPTAAAGLVRVEARSTATADQTIVVFGLGTATWAEVERFAASPPRFDSPTATMPPILEVAFIGLPARGTSSGFGDAAAGMIGVACLAGTEAEPRVVLAGPFELRP